MNQGILQTTGFVNDANINPAGTWSLGLLQMDFFYREKPWYAGQFVRKIVPKIKIPQNAILYFTTVLNKQKPLLLPVLVRDVDKTFRDINIALPVTADRQIDFAFMEILISELKMDRITKLETYLFDTGLKGVHLLSEEKLALKEYDKLTWGKFNLEDLYGKATRGKRLKSADRIPGNLPFVTAGEGNEGVSDFIGNAVHIFAKNTITIDMFGSAKYRDYEYGGDDHVAVVHTEKLPIKAAIFVTAAIHKSAHTGQFHYGRNFYAKDADRLHIMLPVKNGQPDYKKMNTIISAIQKMILKDVVSYVDQKTDDVGVYTE